jgi:predicted ATPase
VIADETHEHMASLFACLDLGELEVRGFEQSHRAWRVLGEAPSPRANRERRPRRLTAFHDRVEESRVLARHWQSACDGHGGAVIIVGEAGIGKSRLVMQFLASVAATRPRIVHLAASAFDENSPLHPVIAFLRNTARLDPDTPREARLARLATVLAGDAAQRRGALPLFGELVGITADDPEIRALSPEHLRERLLAVLVEQLELLADTAPLCLVVEDLHWLDPTSLALIERTVDAAVGRRLMLVLTARDGFDAPWPAGKTTRLPLGRLPSGAVADMMQSLFGSRTVPPQLAGIIARRTDGVPLFVEALTRSLLQLPALPDTDEGPFADGDPAIPASLRESLMARLDRSGTAKQIAQVAAVVGRSVRRDVLGEAARLPEAELDHALATLAEADVLFPDDADGLGTYTFTHALLRDAAYDSLLRDDRRMLHQRVARALQRLDPTTLQQQPELYALHLAEGGLAEEAAPHWLEAARRSLARSALTEATRLLRRGLAALERLPPVRANLNLRLQLSGLLGPALIGLKGPGSPEAQALYAAAYEMCREVPEEPSHFPIYWGWWRLSRDFQVKRQRAAALLAQAAARNDPALLLQAHHCNWATHYAAADFGRCSEHIRAGLALYAAGDYREHARLYGNHDAKVCAHGEQAQLDWIQGRPRSALAQEGRSLAWADTLDHLGSLVHAMDMQLLHRAYRRDHAKVFELAGALVHVASEHGLTDHRAKGLIFRGWAVAVQDDAAAGLRTLQEGLEAQRAIGTTEDFPVYLSLLAEALIAHGQSDKAVEILSQARVEFTRLEFHVFVPEMLRMLAHAMLSADPGVIQAADAVLREAFAMAGRQGAAMLRLRIATTRVRLGRRTGPLEQSARELAAALAGIAEDDGGPDITQARVLMEQLRARIGAAGLALGPAAHD